jgi:hypothetical protein
MFDVDLIVLNKVVVYIRREIGAAVGGRNKANGRR